ncbi:unnamed protein product, partial [Prorocentrum cordatum]
SLLQTFEANSCGDALGGLGDTTRAMLSLPPDVVLDASLSQVDPEAPSWIGDDPTAFKLLPGITQVWQLWEITLLDGGVLESRRFKEGMSSWMLYVPLSSTSTLDHYIFHAKGCVQVPLVSDDGATWGSVVFPIPVLIAFPTLPLTDGLRINSVALIAYLETAAAA